MKRSITTFAVLLLSACGGNSPDSADKNGLNDELNRRCVSLGGAGATVVFSASDGCPDCAAADEQNAIDGEDATFASLTAPVVSTGQMSLRATAPAGTTFPAEANAALTLSVANGSGFYIGSSSVDSSNRQDWHVTIRTYLGGTLQEQDAGFVSVSKDSENERHIVGTTTTLPFDSIEAIFDRPAQTEDPGNINVTGSTDYAQPGDVQVHEFCGDFDLSGLDVQED